LHGHKVACAAYDEVVALHLSPGLADRDAELDDAGHEDHFGPLAAGFLSTIFGFFSFRFFQSLGFVMPLLRTKKAAFVENSRMPPHLFIE
jgi:hypothetical protein